MYGVNENHLLGTLMCESGLRSIQSRIPSNIGPNGQEDSWGVAQIYLPAHPEITKEQALDADFAIRWAAKEFASGRAKQWTCWRTLYT